MRKTSLQDPRSEVKEILEPVDPVYIGCYSPEGYYLHFIQGDYFFCLGIQDAEIWSQEAAEEFCYRNQIRNYFLDPVKKPAQDI